MVDTAVCGFALTLFIVCVGAIHNEGDEAYKRSRFHIARNHTARNQTPCTKAQSNIDFNELMGLWKVKEVIEHSERYTDRHNYLRTVFNSDSCPVVHFSKNEERKVQMLWSEERGYIQFEFILTNINNPGFWLSVGYQSGTLVDNKYRHFQGTVQVMKAVQTHMVLTFCAPEEYHFSIILARNNYLSHEEVRGVHKQLHRVNLPLVNIQSYCKSCGVFNGSSLCSIIVAIAVSCRLWLT